MPFSFITYKLDVVFHLWSRNALTGATDAIIGYFISFLCCNTGKMLKKWRKYIVVPFFYIYILSRKKILRNVETTVISN